MQHKYTTQTQFARYHRQIYEYNTIDEEIFVSPPLLEKVCLEHSKPFLNKITCLLFVYSFKDTD